MQRAKPFLQGAAVASALILAGGFVAYRAGAFDRVVLVEVQPEPAANGTDPASAAYLSGSKSSFVFVGDQAKPPAEPPMPQVTPVISPTFMAGSKSFIPVIDPTRAIPPTNTQQPAQTAPPALKP
jgi:hypothetical protein